MEKILIDDLISIIYAHHKKVNHYAVEQNHEAKYMSTEEKVAMAQNVLKPASNTKRIKKDKGLIERTESSKTILTEDNKELLVD